MKGLDCYLIDRGGEVPPFIKDNLLGIAKDLAPVGVKHELENNLVYRGVREVIMTSAEYQVLPRHRTFERGDLSSMIPLKRVHEGEISFEELGRRGRQVGELVEKLSQLDPIKSHFGRILPGITVRTNGFLYTR